MAHWGSARPIGGLLAVGFLDEHRVVVGSHSGLGVSDAENGTRLDRVEDLDGDYAWFRESPPMAVYPDEEGEHLVAVAGLWGGSLPEATADGWTGQRLTTGAVLSRPDGVEATIDDDDEPRAWGVLLPARAGLCLRDLGDPSRGRSLDGLNFRSSACECIANWSHRGQRPPRAATITACIWCGCWA